ncbi:Fe-S cluster assembly sulfur transfer protein SufU [methanotrophic endosymbiont of Bathymodiolus puteoserpentis (Logatchev)]|jgi:nitrogen fixation NifU-like protein|uniref:Fe-S cluster assembly sulfur transfer protein SufU n=1 Tax=methanotrophic endosymbiont of Bathymodiolus puteoserpentis (Logatchev) TaxID=343235 RepID=UPI00086B0FF5|nr:SUF system NifU family Fe-S cluster assembly protein [methanotrophic endosymbiont of Bathymodiolus puteoserpentis (Logatchev)]SCN46684.1 Putative iron-sulfur cluster assembly scaffold protein for SUF system, SufE2 [methanotrophic endosymbiont of Bathymodiolus azoricus (Menez Gwen)]SHE22307.1 Putative iron-sulfur cluster assembly scaffold protein for SUF system, SufE2 [methanotrophic endosymbiont of Bathymodiolus puteoserpentis (Logatchev)]
MFDDLRDLYQEVIFDHNRNPRNFRVMEDADRKVEGFNPLCGDRLTLFLKMDGDKIIDASFQGSGCAISTASVSLMTEIVKGKTEAEAEDLFRQFHEMTTGKEDKIDLEAIGKLAVLAGVREYPARVKCATLAWHTLDAALKNEQEAISTE